MGPVPDRGADHSANPAAAAWRRHAVASMPLSGPWPSGVAPMSAWPDLIRDIHDFPRPGIVFKDITPVLADAGAFAAAIAALAGPWRAAPPDAVAGIESRGFILGAARAHALGCRFAPWRTPASPSGPPLAPDCAPEFGHDRLGSHVDALHAGARVLVLDDVLATGGTLRAATALVRRLGAQVCGADVLVELAALLGRGQWDDPAPLRSALVL